MLPDPAGDLDLGLRMANAAVTCKVQSRLHTAAA